MRLLGLIGLLLASTTACALAPLQVTQVAPGVYVHIGVPELPDKVNHGAIANIGFIVGERCVAVIDTGGNPEEGQALQQAIKDTTAKPVCYVINSHVHPDHIYGNRVFQDGKVKFVGHQKLARAMATRGHYYIDKAAEQLGVALSAKDIVPPDISVSNTLKLDLGGRELLLTAHGTAHTDNDLSIYDARTDTLWLADLLFGTHLPVVDGSALGWLRELQQLEQRHFTYVIPGHGPVVTDWPKGMQAEKEYLQGLVTAIRQLQKQGKYLEDAVAQLKVSAPHTWALVNEFHRKNITSVFAELEWADTD